MNISSAVVKTRPEHLAAVKATLADSGLCDIHFSDEKGRIVITIEGDDDSDEATKLKKIANLPAVVSADFAYTYRGEVDD